MAQLEPSMFSQSVVLAVDDDLGILNLLSDLLGAHGCVVRGAQNGVVALESARSAPPDLILLAIGLPDLDGYTLCAQLKGDPHTRAVPVIFLSARHEPFEVVRAFAVGAVDYILKPFANEEVLARVQVHLSVRHMQRQLREHEARLEHEMSERKQAEAALRERERQIRSISDNLPNGIIYQLVQHNDGTFAFSYMSGAVERLTGYTAEQVIAQPTLVLDAHDEADRDRYAAAVAESARNLTIFEFETRQRVANGTMRWRQFSSSPQRQPDGTIIWDGICIDITPRKELEATLRAREEQFRLTFEQSPLGVAMVTLDYRFTQVNDMFCTITGYTRDELLERDVLSITHPDDRDAHFALFNQLGMGKQNQYTLEKRYMHKDGYIVWVRVHGRVVRDGRGQPLYYLGLIEDISARKVAEVALRASEERYRRLFETSLDAIIIADEEGTYVDANQAAAKMFGIPREHLIGMHISQLQAADGPDSATQCQEYRARDGARGEFVFYRPDGERRVAQYAAVRIGPSLHQSILRDITDQKAAAAELERARLAAEQANRAKSDFVAHISHEIRTPMNAVIGLTTLLLNSPLTPAQRDDVETIRRSSGALLALINDILDLSKIEAGKLALEYHPFSLRACVEEALTLIAPLADAKQLKLRYSPDPALPDVFVGDQARLRQILINLLSNAVRFTERGAITVTITGARRVPTADAEPLWDIAITVRDTGIGIAPAHLTRIFQPFEQASTATTRRYGGSGLGLAISRHLAQLMGGQIRVASTPGAGSTFTVELAALATDTPPPPYLLPAQPALAGRCALVLADSAEEGATLARQITAWCMSPAVFVATSDALAWIRAGQPVAVILLARDGPIASDVALVDELRAAAGLPALPIVLWATISQREQVLGQIDGHDSLALLQLPFRPAVLHDTLLYLLSGDGMRFAPGIDPIDGTMAEWHPLRILLAEDNTTNQEVARRLLAKLGYQVDVAVNGLDVIEALKRQSYDLVLMDVEMPEMSGTEATSYIRTFWPPERQPRIAALTAYASEEHRTWLLNSGMDDYIRKPVRMEELVRVLQSARSRPLVGDRPFDTGGASDMVGMLSAELFATFLAGVGGQDPAADAAFIASYVADMDAQMQELRAALFAADVVRSMRVAHTLKGLSLQIGALDLALLLGRIEAAGAGGSTVDGAELLETAEVAYAALQRVLAERGVVGDMVNG